MISDCDSSAEAGKRFRYFGVGETTINGNCIYWTLPENELLCLQNRFHCQFYSKEFEFEGEERRVGVQNHLDYIETWFSPSLVNKKVDPNSFRVQFGIVKSKFGEVFHIAKAQYNEDRFTVQKWVRPIELQSVWNDITKNDCVRIVCEIVKVSPGEEIPNMMMTEKRNECSSQDLKNYATLSRNLKELFESGVGSDITIKVKDRLFQVHRTILIARSSVFAAMLNHNMIESNSNVIPVEDCDPGVFHNFLTFIYSGKVENLSNSNVQGLYYAADKYDLPGLKEECLLFMKESLSIKTFSDVVFFATFHNENALLENCAEYFFENNDEIKKTKKWKQFLNEKPIESANFCSKAEKIIQAKMQEAEVFRNALRIVRPVSPQLPAKVHRNITDI